MFLDFPSIGNKARWLFSLVASSFLNLHLNSGKFSSVLRELRNISIILG